MTIKTVIEIDHTRLADLIGDEDGGGRNFRELVAWLHRLRGGMPHGAPDGIRILGQRHGSETLELKVGA